MKVIYAAPPPPPKPPPHYCGPLPVGMAEGSVVQCEGCGAYWGFERWLNDAYCPMPEEFPSWRELKPGRSLQRWLRRRGVTT